MSMLYKKIAEEKAYDIVVNKEITDFEKLSDEDRYELTSYLLERDEFTEGFGADNREFDRMQKAMLRCMRNPCDQSKIDLANTLIDCVSSYYSNQAVDIIESVMSTREMFRGGFCHE